MAANSLFGAVILLLTLGSSYSTTCWCSYYPYRYSADCCWDSSWKVTTTQKPIWDMWSTKRPFWDARITQKPTTRSTTRTTRDMFWDRWTTRKLITTLSPYYQNWSQTPSPSTSNVVTIIGSTVGSVISFAFICCILAACVRVRREQRRSVQAPHTLSQPQAQLRSRGIFFIVIRRILWRPYQGSNDREYLIPRQQVNSGIFQSTPYDNYREPRTPVSPPPYSTALPSVPPPPYSEYI